MTNTAQRVFEQALELSDDDRGQLAGLLLESLESDSSEDVEAAWRTVIARRMAELDDGNVQPVPWDDAEAMIFGEPDADAGQTRVPS